MCIPMPLTNFNFNPLSPCGERPRQINPVFLHQRISIHSPHAGRDFSKTRRLFHVRDISIHSPHAGRDQNKSNYYARLQLISIHSPHAGRDSLLSAACKTGHGFQSTLPMRGETGYNVVSYRGEEFQSTLPMRGETRIFQGIYHSN